MFKLLNKKVPDLFGILTVIFCCLPLLKFFIEFPDQIQPIRQAKILSYAYKVYKGVKARKELPFVLLPQEAAGDNAAYYYQAAANMMYDLMSNVQLDQKFKQFDPGIRYGWDQDEGKDADRFLEDMAPVLALFQQGSSLDKCDFYFGQARDDDAALPFSPLFRLGKLALLKARDYQQQSQDDKALELYCQVMRYIQHLSQDKSIICGVAVIAFKDLVFDNLQDSISKNELNVAQYQKIFQSLQWLENNEVGLDQGVMREQIWSAARARRIGNECVYQEASKFSSPYYQYSQEILVNEQALEVESLQAMAAKLRNVDLGVLEMTKDIFLNKLNKALDKELLEKKIKQKGASYCSAVAHVLVAVSLPRFDSLIFDYFYSLVQVRLLRLGCAARIYQTQHGSLPKSLTELQPEFFKELPNDPFHNQALSYNVQNDAVRIYSIGPDRKDSHGEAGYDKKTMTGDIRIEINN